MGRRKSTQTLFSYLRGNGPRETLIPLIEDAYDEVDRLQGVIQELSGEFAASRAAQLVNFHAAQASELTSAQAVIYQSRLQINYE
jgi:hypothetical protein